MHKSKTASTIILVALLAAACSDNKSNISAPLLDDTNASLDLSLMTGASSAETEAFWLCTVSNADTEISNFVMQFWADKTGVAGQESMNWSSDSSTVEIQFQEGALTLEQFAFGQQANGSALFVAESNGNDKLACNYNGPAQSQAGAFSDFTDQSDQRILNSADNVNDIWACLATDPNKLSSSRQYSFWANGLGTSHNGNFNWFYNDDGNIVLSYSDEILELRHIEFEGNGQNPTSFTAAERQYQLSCTR